MKSIRSTISGSSISIIILLLLACGGGGGGGESNPVDSTPVISNLQFSPTSALQYEGNGTLTVTGTVDFTDQGNDVSTLYIISSDGSVLSSPIEGVSGETSGTIQGVLEADTSTIGTFSTQVYIVDSGGRKSNTLTAIFEVYPDDTGSRWSVQTFPSESLWLKRVRWSGSLLITVGETGSIFTSMDATTWTGQASGTSSMLNDVCWTGSQFITVGNNSILTSGNASAWTARAIPPVVINPILNGVAASSTRIVAVGSQRDSIASTYSGLILTSTDGATWTAVPGTFQASLNAVIWAGGQFVAVGNTLGLPNSEAVAYTSPDGLTWSSHSITSLLTTLYDISWNGSRYVAVGYAGAVTSLDGISWQPTGLGVVGPNYAISWSGQRFMTCGTVYCQASTDGIQWQSTQLPGVGPSVYGIAWNGAKWTVVGTNSYVATSP